MSLANKERYKLHPETFKGRQKGLVCITNGVSSIYIKPDLKLPDGYRYGLIHTKYQRKMDTAELHNKLSTAMSGKNNGMRGKGYLLEGGNNGKAVKRYYFNDLIFECRKDLVIYLKIDTKISSSTTRMFEKGSSRVIREHPILKT